MNFDKTNVETKPKVPVINRDCEFALTSTTRAIPLRSFRDENVCSAQVPTGIDRGKSFPDTIRHSSESERSETILHTYLERQGRNEFINLATQIGYDGKNIAFVFYENQVRRLMEESPYDERRLEVLRASCTRQPREMVNLFCVPMKNLTTAQRIERALDRLRQRYGVSGGFTSEPNIIAIRNGPKVSFDLNSLKMFNEDLNTLEVFAFAHDEAEKLSGQLLLDTASRLPTLLKRRYLDFLDRKGLNLSRPGFDSLREFVVHEIRMMTSDYAQAFFRSDNKEGQASSRSKGYRVRQVTVSADNTRDNGHGKTEIKATGEKLLSYCNRRSTDKPLPACFVCAKLNSKHYLADCETFKAYSPEIKRKTVIDAKRCLNCLSPEHFARECPYVCKCRKCGPNFPNKHATALHECHNGVKLGAATSKEAKTPTRGKILSANDQDLTVHRINSIENRVILMRTSAVKVVNPITGKSTLAYAQHDTASQATLISDSLKTELGLKTIPDSSVTLRTLADQKVACGGRTNFKLESLYSGNEFMIKDALVVPKFSDDIDTLPHAVDTSALKHFDGVHIPIAPGRGRIDVLIGQSDKSLLTVLEEREGGNPEEPNYVLTRLGPIASGGRIERTNCANSLSALRINVVSSESCNLKTLEAENASLKQAIREYELKDEEIQPSRNDELAYQLTEPEIKVKKGRYEIPVPLKPEVVKSLPDNYENALSRIKSLRKKALGNPNLNQTLVDTFAELISEEWIVPVEEPCCDVASWYLPFFVTKTSKPRVVYDGSAEVGGSSLNRAVLSGENLLNNLVEVLIRFRQGKYACVADLTKCFFQVRIPREQQDLFRIVWFKDNDVANGSVQVYRFTRHVWGINSSPFIALLAIKRLVEENCTNANQLTLDAITKNRYMDDMLIAGTSLESLRVIVSEGIELFASCGFRLRKWVANSHAKEILESVPHCDLASCLDEVDLGTSEPLPNSKTLGLTWDPQNDKLCVNGKEFSGATTRREMSSQLASQFDPLGMASPHLLKGKLILQKVARSGVDWDEVLSVDVQDSWKKWLSAKSWFQNYDIPRNCFPDKMNFETESAKFQLHGFCDASNSAFCCVVYLRCIFDDRVEVKFILGKSRLVLTHQNNWVISRKELQSAKMCAEVMLLAQKSFSHIDCSIHFWTDSKVVLGWITNSDLMLARFVKRRVDSILSVAPSSAWKYVSTAQNPADVGTRETSCNNSYFVDLWLNGPDFLLLNSVNVNSESVPIVCRTSVQPNGLADCSQYGLDKLTDSVSSLYILKKRLAYLVAFTQFVVDKAKGIKFKKPDLNVTYLDLAFIKAVKYVQSQSFGAAMHVLSAGSPDDFEAFIKSRLKTATNNDDKRRVNELKALRNLRPCVGPDELFRIDGRLENADLPVDMKHPLILPGRHHLTRLIVLYEHTKSGHAGPSYTLMNTRQRFWIIHGIGSVKHYLAECGKCSILKAKPVRQLMADLPECRLTLANKPFKFCGLDYLGYYYFREGRSNRKAWGLLFTCLCTRCLHVEVVTSLDLDSFLLAFSRFTNLRGAVDTIYSDNGSTFRAASERLPNLLDSTDFHNSLRKININWIKIPPYAPSQGGAWEIMVKLFKNALSRTMDNCRRTPSLIELQTFFIDAVRIVNDRPITTVSDHPNDLSPLTPSCFLGQHLSPNTPLGGYHDKGDLRKDYIYNATLAHRFWLSWIKSYIPTLQARNKWRTLGSNLVPGQLVLVGDAEDLSRKGAYRLVRIHCLHPQIRIGKEIVRRATVAVIAKNSPEGDSNKVEYILRDLSKIAPV